MTMNNISMASAMMFIPVPDFDMGLGFGGGPALKYAIAGQLSVSAEASFYYRSLGSSEEVYDDEDFRQITSASADEMAVSVPVMLQLTLVPSVPLYVAAGIQLEVPFSTKWKYKDEVTYSDGEVNVIADFDGGADERSSADFGIAFGAGYMILPSLGVDFRYVINVNDIADLGSTTLGSFVKKTSLSIVGFGVTYYFN
jgi:hypothetical protein